MKNRDTHLVTDADNTLWNTNAIYAHAQLALLNEVEGLLGFPYRQLDRLSFIRQIDETVAMSNPLRWGYPPQLLVRGLATALSNSSAELVNYEREVRTAEIRPEQIDELAERFRSRIRSGRPELRDGVSEVIATLARKGTKIIVATEEERERSLSLLEYHGLLNYIDDVVSGRKGADFFRALSARIKGARDFCFMVVDQLERDIAPPKETGFIN
jgi:putative hydrolase of the HAD superfamily